MTPIDPRLTQAGLAVPVRDAVQSASARTGIDFDYLVDVARVESRFNPTAQAPTSSARGLYQFTRQTWLATLDRHGASHGLRSEEHTSELQSLMRTSYALFCLKKKKQHIR